MRNALIALLGALVVLLVLAIVDRQIVRPRREADALVAAARPHASATHEGSWITAESLLARAELLHRGRADVAELRAKLAENRKIAAARDEQIVAAALAACIQTLDKAGYADDVQKLRADTTSSKRDLHVRCMRVQLEHLAPSTASSAP